MDTNDELDNNVQRSISDVSNNELCTIHNEEYILVSDDNMYCDKCDTSCYHVYNTIDEWKKQTLIEMKKFEDKLNNKIKGLNCICEIINNHVDNNSIIKQIEDIIDTIYVDISHIYNFNQLINDLPTSNIIKRKNIILNNKSVILIDTNKLDKHLIEFIDIIIQNDGDIHTTSEYALVWASTSGHLDVVKCLIKYGADIHADNDLALRWGCCRGHLAVAEFLISNGVNIHAYDDSALCMASYHGHLDVVKYLISHGANIHAQNDRALKLASQNGHLGVVECLIKYGADIDTYKDFILKCTLLNGHLAVAEYLKLSINRT